MILVLSVSASCATSLQSPKQKITVRSNPMNAEVITSHGYGCEATPCSFKVPRNKGFTLKVTKPGFTTESVRITPMLSAVGTAQGLGSVALGGILAGGYDVYKGSVLELTPNEVTVDLKNMSAMLFEEVRIFSNMDIFSN